MDSFFDLIFNNFFIVIIIIFAIVNLFSKSKKASEEAQQDNSQDTGREPHKKRSIQDLIEEKVEEAKESYQQMQDTVAPESKEKPKPRPKSEATISIEEQRQEQYEQLKRRLQPSHQQKGEEDVYNRLAQKQQVGAKPQSTDLAVSEHLGERLTREGLAESIVMAEVLGPPRALNPYQNVAMRRRRQ